MHWNCFDDVAIAENDNNDDYDDSKNKKPHHELKVNALSAGCPIFQAIKFVHGQNKAKWMKYSVGWWKNDPTYRRCPVSVCVYSAFTPIESRLNEIN